MSPRVLAQLVIFYDFSHFIIFLDPPYRLCLLGTNIGRAPRCVPDHQPASHTTLIVCRHEGEILVDEGFGAGELGHLGQVCELVGELRHKPRGKPVEGLAQDFGGPRRHEDARHGEFLASTDDELALFQVDLLRIPQVDGLHDDRVDPLEHAGVQVRVPQFFGVPRVGVEGDPSSGVENRETEHPEGEEERQPRFLHKGNNRQ